MWKFWGSMMDSYRDKIVKAHEHCSNNKTEIKRSKKCGCFYCCDIFDASEVKQFIEADNKCDKLGTAVCPKCGIDSVIGDASGYSVNQQFMQDMHRHWF